MRIGQIFGLAGLLNIKSVGSIISSKEECVLIVVRRDGSVLFVYY